MKYAFAGDRNISLRVLKHLISKGHYPEALIVTEGENSTHSEQLIKLSNIPTDRIFYGTEFKTKKAIDFLKSLDLDYIFGIHFPLIIPKVVLEIPKVGFMNLHPAYLPYNKGWNTPTWAILDQTPYGATLHFMEEKLDAGDIVLQKEIKVEFEDTANTLYQKTLDLEFEVFKEALPDLLTLKPTRSKQKAKGTAKSKNDLKDIQEIDLSKTYTGAEIIDKLRAHTTNRLDEAVYFIKDGERIAIQVNLKKIKEE